MPADKFFRHVIRVIRDWDMADWFSIVACCALVLMLISIGYQEITR